MHIRAILAGLAACFLLCASAQAEITDADILSYNVAVQSGDSEQLRSAAKQLASSAMLTPNHPHAGRFAYEAGWALSRVGDFAEAARVAEFADSRAGAGADTGLLKAYTAWKIKSSPATLSALDAALSAFETAGPNGLSVTAFRDRYVGEVQDRDFNSAALLAQRATKHFAIGGDPFAEFVMEARLVDLTSRFNAYPKVEQFEEIVHLRGELAKVRGEAGDDAPDWVNDYYWNANAWQLAIGAYFTSVKKKHLSPKETEAILASYEEGLYTDLPPVDNSSAEEKLRLCEGSLIQKPAMRYPSGSGRKGKFGAVIVKFQFEDGNVRDPEVLAAVPFEGFREDVIKTMSKWTYKPSEDPAVAGCGLDYDNVVQEYVFALR